MICRLDFCETCKDESWTRRDSETVLLVSNCCRNHTLPFLAFFVLPMIWSCYSHESLLWPLIALQPGHVSASFLRQQLLCCTRLWYEAQDLAAIQSILGDRWVYWDKLVEEFKYSILSFPEISTFKIGFSSFLKKFEVIIFPFKVYICAFYNGNIIKFLIINFISNIWMSWLVFVSFNLKVSIKMIHRCIWRTLMWFHLLVRQKDELVAYLLDLRSTFVSHSHAKAPCTWVHCPAAHLI